MIEEPYRWLEAVANRREYVVEQLQGGSPALAVSLEEGILLLGVGTGQSKVFELFDRHALGGLGHPADIEKIRQAAIDTAHTEAFVRAPEDVSLRRLVSFGLSPQLKTNFEQIFSAPFLVELILAEVGPAPTQDLLVRLRFDGSFQMMSGGVAVAASKQETEAAASQWLRTQFKEKRSRSEAADLLLQAWWCALAKKDFDKLPEVGERQGGWREAAARSVVEVGWLKRQSARPARFEAVTLQQLGL